MLIRYGALQAIGLFVEDLGSKVIRIYGADLLDRLFEVLFREEVPRVLAHAMSALDNLVSHMNFESLEGRYEEIIGRVLGVVRTGCSLLKESGMSLMKGLLRIGGVAFAPYMSELFL